MDRDEFIGKLNMIYVGEVNAIEDIITEYDRLNNIINELEEYICNIEYDERIYNETLQIAVKIHNKLKKLKENNDEQAFTDRRSRRNSN